MISFLQEMDEVEEVLSIPGWRAHRLSGDRKEVWSLNLSRNWRLTFRVDGDENEIYDLDYEDYH